MASIFPIVQVYDRVVADDGRTRAFICLTALLLAFLLIRTSARMTRRFTWWPGGVETEGGIHLHHFVWGIFLMLASGFVGLSLHIDEPWGGIVAAIFGVGAGLTLDEFALWTRMEDVYWSEEGRSSLEAVAIVAVVGMLVVVGIRPFELNSSTSAISATSGVAISLTVAAAAFMKGRILLGAIGVFILPVGLVGAIRVARPNSPWARRRYPVGCKKLARSERRFDDPSRRGARFSRWLQNTVGGRPTDPDMAAED